MRRSSGVGVVNGVVGGAAALAVVVGCDGGRLPEADTGTGHALIACGAGATITEVEVAFGGLAVGPDGNIWYTHESNVGCVTPAGKFHDLRCRAAARRST